MKTECSCLEENIKNIKEKISRILGQLVTRLGNRLTEIKKNKLSLDKIRKEIERTGSITGILAWVEEFCSYVNDIRGLENIKEKLNKMLELIESKETVEVNELKKAIHEIIDEITRLIREKGIQELCQDEQKELLSRNLALALAILPKSDSTTVLNIVRKEIDNACKQSMAASELLRIVGDTLQKEIIALIQNKNTKKAIRDIFERLFKNKEVLNRLRIMLYSEVKEKKLDRVYDYILSEGKKEWKLQDLLELGITDTVKLLLLLMVACLVVVRIEGEKINIEKISLEVIELYSSSSEFREKLVVKYLYNRYIVKIKHKINILYNLREELSQLYNHCIFVRFGYILEEIRRIIKSIVDIIDRIIKEWTKLPA